MATDIDLDAILSQGRDAIIRAYRGSTNEDWPSLVLQIPTLIAAIRARDARIVALTAAPPSDERAAAERAVIAAALSYYQKEYDGMVPARGMREAFQALWRTIKVLGDSIATERARAADVTAKEGE